ncbi:MAG: ABC transporter substrate-binding protein, partial [Clostridia bacterium]|nr:ABC transporter substrate-binding protein [Clostridia bacterium]
MKKLLSVLLSLALMTVLLLPASVAEGDKVVNIGATSTITSLNPLAMDNTEIVKYATSLVFLPLVELNSDLEFVPQLAQSITTDDNLNFTRTLQDNAAWSDGTPVTAEDIEFSLVVAADPDSANASLAMYAIEGTDDGGLIESGAEHISGIQVVDDKTLTVTTKWPTALYTFENNFG